MKFFEPFPTLPWKENRVPYLRNRADSMASGCKWKPIFWVLLLLTCFGHSNPYSRTSSSDFSSLVYAQCANQTFSGATEAYHRTLSALYQQLLTESSRSKFFKSTAGDESLGISGLFQCRGDLGNDDCRHCVGDLPDTLSSRCRQAVAARVQLSGCFLRYETDGFPEHELWPSEGGGGGRRSGGYEYELLHEKCSSDEDSSSDFKTAREDAFKEVEDQLAKGEIIGFSEKEVEHVKVVAQCEGDLAACDCGECVTAAAEIAEVKCGSSVSGEVYLDKCFLRYSYDSEDSSTSATAKTIALAVGGAVAFCCFIAFLKYMKSNNDKCDDSSSDC